MYKNIIDRGVAAIGLVVLSPLVLALAWLIRARLGTPVLFRQIRIGRGEKPFTLLKFRTMTGSHDSRGMALPDGQRLTSFGQLLRASSLDELPQLWNVLKGDMSMVGPRPLLPEYLPRYTAIQRRRHEVRPGITGWVQVNGRNRLTWEQKFELDVWYVDHRNVCLDARILWLTALRVLCSDGITHPGHATTPEFVGSQAPERGTE